MSEDVKRLKCPECGGPVELWTDLWDVAQANCVKSQTDPKLIEIPCDWGTFNLLGRPKTDL